jgi:DNA-binding LacI/PurR family transcriptional regulator/signal transduction histidine kinase
LASSFAQGKQRAIALFLYQVHGYFRAAMIRGMKDFAARAGIDLFVLAGISKPGASPKDLDPGLRLASSDRLDGIILGGTRIATEDRDSVAAFLLGLGKPVISVSNSLPGIPCAHADNRAGIAKAVEHLALTHGKERIAFLGGPAWSLESRPRYEAYAAALEGLGRPLEPELVFPGDFLARSGEALAQARAHGTVAAFDALVCANDCMAAAFEAECEELGLRVPGDVALCGFNDDPDALRVGRPLTTARQPIAGLCEAAGSAILRNLDEGIPIPEDIEIPTDFIVRESCGCSLDRPAGLEVETARSAERPLAREADALVEALKAEADGLSAPGSFDSRVAEALARHRRSKADIYDLRHSMSLSFASSAGGSGSPEWAGKARALLAEGRLVMGRAIDRIMVRDILYLEKALGLLNEFAQGIGRPRDWSLGDAQVPRPARAIAETLDRVLAEARIGYCALSLFGGKGLAASPPESILVYARGSRAAAGGAERPAAVHMRFSTADILPDEALPDSEGPVFCMALPLVDSGLVFGFIFFRDDIESLDFLIQEIFRAQIANALGRARVEDELLEKEMRQRVETEKLEAMGTLIAGIAHEINTPLGVCITAASASQMRAAELRRSFADGKLTRSELESYLADSEQTASILWTNVDRAASLVSSFKKIAVDSSSEDRRFFNLGEYTWDVIAALGPALKRTSIRFTVDCPAGLEIDSYPGAYSQVLTNLIQNSVKHGFGEAPGGSIAIRAALQDRTLTIVYSDDGKGIPDEIVGRVFDPYFTTSRDTGGSGLGLYIAHNIVAGVFKGRISAGKAEGGGAKFTISAPIEKGECRYARR